MRYVIQSVKSGNYQTPLGSACSYVRSVYDARTFATRADAVRASGGYGECVIEFSDAERDYWSRMFGKKGEE